MNDEINPILPMARQQSEAKRDAHLWRSCCVEMDSRALLFFSQLLISLIILLFCVWRISRTDDAQWAKMTATFVIGVWLPAPRAGSDRRQ